MSLGTTFRMIGTTSAGAGTPPRHHAPDAATTTVARSAEVREVDLLRDEVREVDVLDRSTLRSFTQARREGLG